MCCGNEIQAWVPSNRIAKPLELSVDRVVAQSWLERIWIEEDVNILGNTTDGISAF